MLFCVRKGLELLKKKKGSSALQSNTSEMIFLDQICRGILLQSSLQLFGFFELEIFISSNRGLLLLLVWINALNSPSRLPFGIQILHQVVFLLFCWFLLSYTQEIKRCINSLWVSDFSCRLEMKNTVRTLKFFICILQQNCSSLTSLNSFTSPDNRRLALWLLHACTSQCRCRKDVSYRCIVQHLQVAPTACPKIIYSCLLKYLDGHLIHLLPLTCSCTWTVDISTLYCK